MERAVDGLYFFWNYFCCQSIDNQIEFIHINRVNRHLLLKYQNFFGLSYSLIKIFI